MPAQEVERFDDELARLAERMTLLMREAHGVGLAANQVGVLAACRRLPAGAEEEPVALVNPRLAEQRRRRETADEGCLSLQGVIVPGRARVPRDVEAHDAPARPSGSSSTSSPRASSQHELDHLDGVLILDRTDAEARREALGDAPPAAVSSPLSRRPCALGVAATAPFGAHVLERLAARHEVAFVLTRPDPPRGRGRRVGAAAGEGGRRAARAPGAPAGAARDVELPDDGRMVLCAYGLLIPPVAARAALWLNVHPSLLPRWRGAAPVERAIMAGDDETGVTIHETVKELDAGPIAAQRPSRSARRTTRARCSRGPPAGRGAARRRAARRRRSSRSRRTASPTPTRSGRRTASSTSTTAGRAAAVRALSPHIGARAVLHGRRRIVWRARVEDGGVRAARGAAGGPPADDLRRVPARAAVTVAPARRAAFSVVRRVLEEDAYADRALRSAVAGLDERDRALAQRLAYGTVQRVRTLDHAIETLGRRPVAQARRARARRAPPRRLPARLRRRRRPLRGRERVRRARARGRLARAVPFANAVLRRVADGIGALLASLAATGRCKAASYPDWVAETLVARPRRRRCARAACGRRTSRPRPPCASPAASATGRARSGPARRVAASTRVDEPALAEGRLAAEPRLAARRAGGRGAGR